MSPGFCPVARKRGQACCIAGRELCSDFSYCAPPPTPMPSVNLQPGLRGSRSGGRWRHVDRPPAGRPLSGGFSPSCELGAVATTPGLNQERGQRGARCPGQESYLTYSGSVQGHWLAPSPLPACCLPLLQGTLPFTRLHRPPCFCAAWRRPVLAGCSAGGSPRGSPAMADGSWCLSGFSS